jgi:hypothetical protein
MAWIARKIFQRRRMTTAMLLLRNGGKGGKEDKQEGQSLASEGEGDAQEK